MVNDIRLRHMTFDDLEEMIALKKDVLNRSDFDPAAERKLYNWELIGNPYRRDDFPVGLVLENGKRIVGMVALVPALFRINQKDTYGCFEIDLAVANDFRFHGLKLLNLIWRSDKFPVVVGTTPNKTSYDIETRLGALEIPFTRYYCVKVINPPKVLIKKKGSRISAILAWFMLQRVLLRGYLSRLNKNFSEDDYVVEKIDSFTEQFDQFFEKAATTYSALVVKNSRYLNWRYVEFPFGERVIYMVSDRKGDLSGYIVIQHEILNGSIKVARILDIFTLKNDANARRMLLRVATTHAKSSGLESVYMNAVDAFICDTAATEGFITRQLALPVAIYRSNEKVREGSLGWFLSSGDGDASTFSALSWKMTNQK
ncbi:MAG: hypothetical protein NC938_06570 [Candidatus Omnitrophica bacterium]|nr:hypothetical protein [Candidatus Omnitrophota bacterium]MCM8791340.1 hypothetical protein [Candidatus Omnitrophota bacterium]